MPRIVAAPSVPPTHHAESIPAATVPNSLPVPDDEALYAQAMQEVETGNTRTGLWAKAFAEADGDEKRQKALYLRYRVAAEKVAIQQNVKGPVGSADNTSDSQQSSVPQPEVKICLSSAPKISSVERDFRSVLDQLGEKGISAIKASGKWKLYEPIGGTNAYSFSIVEFSEDRQFLEYVKTRVQVPKQLFNECAGAEAVESVNKSCITLVRNR